MFHVESPCLLSWTEVFDQLRRMEMLHSQTSPDPSFVETARQFARACCASNWRPPASVCQNQWGRIVFSWPGKSITV